jgi:hypothetical protein
LLEFQLTGPLEKPDWNFVNLSKDIQSLPKEAAALPKDVSGLILRPKEK